MASIDNLIPELLQEIQECTEILRREPHNTQALKKRAVANTRLGVPELALQDLQRLVNLGVEDSDTSFLMGRAYYKLRDFVKAEEMFTQSIKLSPEDPYARHQRSIVRINLENYSGAISDIDEALRGGTVLQAELYNNRAFCQVKMGEENLAKRDLLFALDELSAIPKDRRVANVGVFEDVSNNLRYLGTRVKCSAREYETGVERLMLQ